MAMLVVMLVTARNNAELVRATLKLACLNIGEDIHAATAEADYATANATREQHSDRQGQREQNGQRTAHERAMVAFSLTAVQTPARSAHFG